MDIDNPGNLFDPENFFDGTENNEENLTPVKMYGNFLLKKSIDILNTTTTIGDLLEDIKDGETTKNLMLQNAMMIPPKIKGNLAINIYSMMMENAVIIKVNFMELYYQLWACEEIHGIDKEYTKVLRSDLYLFKALFTRWIKCFDKAIDVPDEWHIFNDPNSFPSPDEKADPQ